MLFVNIIEKIINDIIKTLRESLFIRSFFHDILFKLRLQGVKRSITKYYKNILIMNNL